VCVWPATTRGLPSPVVVNQAKWGVALILTGAATRLFDVCYAKLLNWVISEADALILNEKLSFAQEPLATRGV